MGNTTFVALLRGIAPMNRNQQNEKLRAVCEDLGLEGVRSVLASGNLVFESQETAADLEGVLEDAWQSRLGFQSTTILRSRQDLERIVDIDPFCGLEHGKQTYLLVTFAKSRIDLQFELPHQVPNKDYEFVAATDREVFSVTDTTTERTPDVMGWLEKHVGKDITSRTWLTVSRILAKMT